MHSASPASSYSQCPASSWPFVPWPFRAFPDLPLAWLRAHSVPGVAVARDWLSMNKATETDWLVLVAVKE